MKPFIQPKMNVRAMVSAEEWEARVNLAACYRLIEVYGMTDHISNHVTVRVPGKHNEFLINPYGVLYEQMTASCMIRIDLAGNILFNPSAAATRNSGAANSNGLRCCTNSTALIPPIKSNTKMSISICF